MKTLLPVHTKDQINQVAQLAHDIWTEHYTPIIGEDQVAYMLEKYQSSVAIEHQLKNGMHYYLLQYEDRFVGYVSFTFDKALLFLSKFYVLKSVRGEGIGKAAMTFIEMKAKEFGATTIRLTVNKNNLNSIKAYEKMGFCNEGALVQEIGNGFVMDDYVFEKTLN